MKKKFLNLSLVVFCALPHAHAQLLTLNTLSETTVNNYSEKESKSKETAVPTATWEFYFIVAQPDARRLAEKSNYKFGQEASYLYDLFLDYYVKREEIVPGDPSRRIVIRKPAIYNAVRSIEKHLGKYLGKGENIGEETSHTFTQVLRIALAAFDSDSRSFEDALQANRKNADNLLVLFNNVELKKL